MTMSQCKKCKNSNPQCRQSLVLYYMALQTVTTLANDGNMDSKFFKERENQREYTFDIKCSDYEPKEGNNGD